MDRGIQCHPAREYPEFCADPLSLPRTLSYRRWYSELVEHLRPVPERPGSLRSMSTVARYGSLRPASSVGNDDFVFVTRRIWRSIASTVLVV